MKRVILVPILVSLLFVFLSAFALGDPPDTIVFRTAMSSANEVPAITGASGSGNATITVFVNRDSTTGVITSGTVDFNIDFTGFPANTVFTGLHIHDGPAGVSAGVVIGTNLSGSSTVTTPTGSGNIFRRVVIDGTNARALNALRGLLSQPQLHYVNLHSRVFPGGVIRGQLAATRLVFRTRMTPDQETPPITDLAAVGVATITINISRDASGAAVSGSVDFDVAYAFPSGPITFTGLHIHNGPAGVSAPVVIATSIGGGANSVTSDGGGGNIFRRVDIPSTNAAGLAALNGIVNDPTQFYVNLHTVEKPGGIIRGQLSSDTYSFLKTMLPSFEVPPIQALDAAGRALITAKVTRNASGNITGGSVEFNVDFSMPGPVTFTGLHIHNGLEGISAGVVIPTNLGSGANSVSSDTGIGNITRTVTISSDNATQLTALRGLVDSPERYYVNLHTTDNPGGFVRSQLERNTLAFRVRLRPENEVPPSTINALGNGWVVARTIRDANGNTIYATVDFDISYQFPGSVTITGLHIHEAPAGVNGPVVISSLLSSVTSDSGAGGIFKRNTLSGSNPGLAALDRLSKNPENFYANLHTSVNPGGVIRAQLATNLLFFPQVVGGLGASSSISLTNPSATDSASGIVFFSAPGGVPFGLVNNTVAPFVIPPGGTITLSTNSQGVPSLGAARIVSADTLAATESFLTPGAPPVSGLQPTPTAFGFIAFVSRDIARGNEAIVSVVNVSNDQVKAVLTLYDADGQRIRSLQTAVILNPGDQLANTLGGIFPGVPDSFQGTLRVTTLFPTQSIVVGVIELFPGGVSVGPLFLIEKPTPWGIETLDK